MSRPRYLAVVARQGGTAPSLPGDLPARIGGDAPCTQLHTRRAAIAVLGAPILDLGAGGVIVGDVFDTASMQAVSRINGAFSERIVQHGPRHLIETCWGGYVAFLEGTDDTLRIVRAPLGDLPCFLVETQDAWILASDMDILRDAGLWQPAIDWDQLRIHLAAPELLGPATCLQGVSELRGGQTLALSSRGRSDCAAWSPWSFASRQNHVEDAGEAAMLVEAAVRGCVVARARRFRRVALLLSGGLDSSIVAACLGNAGVAVEALNLVTRDASGDERRYARRVSAWMAMTLHEQVRDVGQVVLYRSVSARLPRPWARVFSQETIRLATALADRTGAEAIFNGGGGDNVFCSLQSAAPAADRLLTTGPGRSFVRTALETSRFAPASVLSVISDAVRRAWLGKPALRPVRDFSLMPPSSSEGVPARDDHPWLQVPRGELPGSAAHVRLIAIAQAYVESLDPQDPIPTIAPLLSQPVVEACLRVPSWLWLEDGRNRAIARRAFARDLPIDILARRTKGTPDSFIAEIFETHRPAIRALLGDGLLARHGLIDRNAVLARLDDPRPARHETFHRILKCVDAESWAQAWSS
ncbi:asparagine synthase-related protein [Novosphingobium kaempferiae]|uniref:asparagine synthase-related protein n=1 Tax=Novosphingobium kaempferiae TaxID=2896849 RepID=UPI001E46C405|nr:asparagine synthase-related protein [Novosphingobium kaempferiae]